MKHFLTIFLTILTVVFAIGCESQNPICNDTLCVTGEVFFKSELPEGTEYDSVNVDTTRLLTALGETPPVGEISKPSLPTGVNPVDMATIVNSVALGDTDYERAYVYLEAVVMEDLTDGERWITLQTENDNVEFRVFSWVKKSQLAQWTKGNRYGFILFIYSMRHETDTATIFSKVDDPDNIAKGRSVLTPTSDEVVRTSIDLLFESFRKGESYYIGKRVSFLDTVKKRRDSDSLLVYDEEVGLFSSKDTFSIFAEMDITKGDIDLKYSEGSLHNFEVTIHYSSYQDFRDPSKFHIVGYFEDKTFLP